MNKELIFAFGENMIRVGGDAENPLFVVNDVCRALEIGNPSQAVAAFGEAEKGDLIQNDVTGRPQKMLAVTEAGLYRLIFRSDKPAARAFQDWVFREVLPSIRKSGHYSHETKLWEAFAQAKTGSVQAMILRQLGIGNLARGAEKIPLKITPGEIWNDLQAAAGIEGDGPKKLSLAFRIGTTSRPASSFEVFMAHSVVLEHLKTEFPKRYRAIGAADFREALSSSPEWIEGDYTQRFGGALAICHAWRFKIENANSAAWCAASMLFELTLGNKI